jgi:hypothetical protein
LQWWLRDVWVQTLGGGEAGKSEIRNPKSEAESVESQVEVGPSGGDTLNPQLSTINSPQELLAFPQLAGTSRVAQRLTPRAAMENLRILEQLQRWLRTNAQEALALEVGLLKLQL